MSRNHMNKNYMLPFVGFLAFGIFAMIMINTGNRRESNQYFKDLNLIFTGIVTDKHVVSNGAGMLYVDVRNTTIPEYDVRGRVSDYYCVIHNGKAELIEGGLFEIHIGDSLVINSQIDSFECFRNNKLVLKKWLRIGYHEPLKSMIERLHRL